MNLYIFLYDGRKEGKQIIIIRERENSSTFHIIFIAPCFNFPIPLSLSISRVLSNFVLWNFPNLSKCVSLTTDISRENFLFLFYIQHTPIHRFQIFFSFSPSVCICEKSFLKFFFSLFSFFLCERKKKNLRKNYIKKIFECVYSLCDAHTFTKKIQLFHYSTVNTSGFV